jgi:CubicO group peptidase (beta-lactamase class C family)
MKPAPILFLILALALLLNGCAVVPKPVSVALPAPDYWPTSDWRSASPESQGMDSVLLAQMLEEITTKQVNIHSVLIVRNGYLVTEAYFHPYTSDTKEHVQSVTKSVIGALVGIAIEKGTIQNVNQTVMGFYPDRIVENPGGQKDAIRLEHLLSMSSGLDCQEFSNSGPTMEQTSGWVQFMLDLPVVSRPGKVFGYCNGNAHLLSALLETSSGINTRQFANQELFRPLGIPDVEVDDWGEDPQGYTIGGYGLHLRPRDLANFAFLYLHNGLWEGKQLLPARWVADSTKQHIQKEDGSGYGYLWTVYPKAGHYAALGLGGQQIHIYPAKNLIVIVTAGLEAYAEAPEIERMLNEYILPSIQVDAPLAENAAGLDRLQTAIALASNPVQPVASLPATALDISGNVYTFGENPPGWQTLDVTFTPDSPVARLHLNDSEPIEVGLDNLYRLSETSMFGEILLRGRWVDEQTFILDYPYPPWGVPRLGELGSTTFQLVFTEDTLQVTITSLILGGDPVTFSGSK